MLNELIFSDGVINLVASPRIFELDKQALYDPFWAEEGFDEPLPLINFQLMLPLIFDCVQQFGIEPLFSKLSLNGNVEIEAHADVNVISEP